MVADTHLTRNPPRPPGRGQSRPLGAEDTRCLAARLAAAAHMVVARIDQRIDPERLATDPVCVRNTADVVGALRQAADLTLAAQSPPAPRAAADRDDLTPAQRVLNAALALNEATYELMSLAQVPAILGRQLVEGHIACPGAEPAFSAVYDKLAEAIGHLHHAAGAPAETAAFARAAEHWTHGDVP